MSCASGAVAMSSSSNSVAMLSAASIRLPAMNIPRHSAHMPANVTPPTATIVHIYHQQASTSWQVWSLDKGVGTFHGLIIISGPGPIK